MINYYINNIKYNDFRLFRKALITKLNNRVSIPVLDGLIFTDKNVNYYKKNFNVDIRKEIILKKIETKKTEEIKKEEVKPATSMFTVVNPEEETKQEEVKAEEVKAEETVVENKEEVKEEGFIKSFFGKLGF